MKEFLPVLQQSRLFSGLNEDEIMSAFSCLSARPRSYSKGAVVFSEGDTPDFIAVIISGEIEIQKIDYNGNSNIISRLFPGEVIAAAAIYSSEKKMPFDVIFSGIGKLLCFDISGLINPCQKSCKKHINIIENLLASIADSNIRLTNKINILTKRSIREKLLEYLYSLSKKSNQKQFEVHLSRQQMADYLSVDRSALSRELTNMRMENILDFDGKLFWFI